MMNDCVEGVPWLEKDGCTTVTATVIEGAEVVRTAAVSYATPILHQVFIQGGSPVAPDSTTVKSSSEYKSYRLDVGSTSSPQSSGLTNGNDCSDKSIKENASLHLPSFLVSSDSSFSHSSSNSSTCSSSSSPVWVFSPTLLSSNSMVLRPVTSSKSSSTFSYQSSPLVSPSTVVSSLASTSTSSVLSPSSLFCSSGVTKTDDELTSLTWLQDSNLLMGTALSPIKHFTPPKSAEAPPTEKKRTARSSGRKDNHSSSKKHDDGIELTLKSTPDNIKHETQEEYKIESPTSDYAEEANELSPPDGSESAENCVGRTSTPKPQAIPYNPKVHVKAKPPFSFSCLIFMAIEESPTKALPVKDIYSWILEHYPYYRNAPTGWKNSVRHNLSLNKCFSKVEKAQNLGKGSLWMVDPTFRPNLLQAMSKTPFTTQSKNDKTYLMSNKAVINTKYLYGLTSKTSEKSISMGDFVVENEVDVLPSTRTVENETVKVESSEILSNLNIEISNTVNTSSSLEKLTTGTESRNSCEEIVKSKPNLYSPDPELFPRLAKRLGTHKMDSFSINFQSEDVDAAAAMLVLKHGPRMLSPYHETFSNMKNSISGFDSMENNLAKRIHKNSDSSDSGSVVISSSPSLDHAYVSKNGASSQERYIFRGKKETISPTSSVDEAFFDDSFESETFGDHPVPSWQDGSRPYEEADALLNLASVATSLASRERFLVPALENDDRLSSHHCSIGLSENDTLAPQPTESQPSYSETQSNTNGTIPDSFNFTSTKPKNTTKRKPGSNLKLPTAKKLATINLASNNLDTKNSSKLISQNKYLNNNYNNNNNNSKIINKNKVKVRKLLKSNKLKY